ncbi:MAG: MoaD/ThiS family protein [Euryarchaeota archaeon]|nr:MoaD/ThiS family protein [Euryarchaeota archaeon]
MRLRVRLLRPFSDAVGNAVVEVAVPEGASVRHLVVHLCEQYPALAPHIYEAGGAITDYLTMFVNDRPITDMGMALGEGDEVLIMFPVSGG